MSHSLAEDWPFYLEDGRDDPESLFSVSKEEAYEALKIWTGQDFGYDVAEWSMWFCMESIKSAAEEERVERERASLERKRAKSELRIGFLKRLYFFLIEKYRGTHS
jgi:hypothetical protein